MNFLKGYKTYIVAAGVVITAIGAYLSDQIGLPEMIFTILGGLGMGTLRAGVKTDTQKVVNKVGIALIAGVLLFGLTSCATNQPPVVTQSSPVAHVGEDLNTAAAQAMDAYSHYAGGNIDYVWAIQFAMNAYQGAIKTGADVKQIVNAWTAGKGKSLGDRLALLFQTSTGTPEQKVQALANAATKVGLASRTSP